MLSNTFPIDDLGSFFESLAVLSNAQDYLESFTNSVGNKLFLTIEDVMFLTGWSKKTVENLFNRTEFPSSDYGKKKIILTLAFVNYFMVPRKK